MSSSDPLASVAQVSPPRRTCALPWREFLPSAARAASGLERPLLTQQNANSSELCLLDKRQPQLPTAFRAAGSITHPRS